MDRAAILSDFGIVGERESVRRNATYDSSEPKLTIFTPVDHEYIRSHLYCSYQRKS